MLETSSIIPGRLLDLFRYYSLDTVPGPRFLHIPERCANRNCRRLFTSPKKNLGCSSPKINLRCTSPNMNLTPAQKRNRELKHYPIHYGVCGGVGGGVGGINRNRYFKLIGREIFFGLGDGGQSVLI